MAHDVRTAVKGDLVSHNLPRFESSEGKFVLAARIVAIGLSSFLGTGTTRLALAGGAHVDVPKGWVLEHKPQIGAYYVKTGPETAEIVETDLFEAQYQPVELGGTFSAEAGTEPAGAGIGEQAADYSELHESESFIAWLKDRAHAGRFAHNIGLLLYKLHGNDPLTAEPEPSDAGPSSTQNQQNPSTDTGNSLPPAEALQQQTGAGGSFSPQPTTEAPEPSAEDLAKIAKQVDEAEPTKDPGTDAPATE